MLVHSLARVATPAVRKVNLSTDNFSGYDFIWADITPFAVPHTDALEWAKVGVISAAFAAYPNAKWLWWLDLDAIIMTPSLPVSTYLSPDGMRSIMLPPDTKIRGPGGFSEFNVSYPLRPMSRWDQNTRLDEDQLHLLLTQDELCGLNDGSFFLKRGVWADWILEMWTDEHYVQREVRVFAKFMILSSSELPRHPLHNPCALWLGECLLTCASKIFSGFLRSNKRY